MLTLIIVLSIICLVEAFLLCLTSMTDRMYTKELYEDRILNKAYNRIVELQNERDDFKRKYEKEKRMVNHKDRVIQAIYRGEIIRLKNKKNE